MDELPLTEIPDKMLWNLSPVPIRKLSIFPEYLSSPHL
jgi:hypothetical protein